MGLIDVESLLLLAWIKTRNTSTKTHFHIKNSAEIMQKIYIYICCGNNFFHYLVINFFWCHSDQLSHIETGKFWSKKKIRKNWCQNVIDCDSQLNISLTIIDVVNWLGNFVFVPPHLLVIIYCLNRDLNQFQIYFENRLFLKFPSSVWSADLAEQYHKLS